MASLKIISWNPAGLHKNSPRTKAKFEFLEKQYNNNNFDILSLQETHHKSQENLPRYIKDLRITHNFVDTIAPESDPAAGIIVLIKKDWKILKKTILLQGRLLQISIQKGSGKVFNILTVYGYPKKSEPLNFEKRLDLFQRIESVYEKEQINMFIGDYNITDSIYDRPINISTSRNKKLDEEWEKIRERIDMSDPFRLKYPTRRLYSFETKDKRGRSRIDKLYINEEEAGNIVKNTYTKTLFDDHKILEIQYESNRQKGKGVWKLNTSLLSDIHYIERIRLAISRVKLEEDMDEDHAKTWDLMMMAVQTVSINYSSEKAFQKREIKKFLVNELEKYNNIATENLTDIMRYRIQNLESQLYKIDLEELNGYKIRTRIPDFEKKDPRIDFYSKFEKKKGEEDIINSLKNSKGETKTEINDLKNIAHDFYSKLYKEEKTDKILQNKIISKVKKRLSRVQRQRLENVITEKEIWESIESLKKGKTPGKNGLPAEFFQTFWSELKGVYTKFINYAYRYGFTENQNTSIIKLIYKKGDNDDLANYRPIALMNTDIKILTKILANRLKDVMPSLIHHTQTCVKGRKIDTTIHTVRDLIQLAEEKNLDAAFIFLDQEKAFDRVNHTFMYKVMRAFNIGEGFIHWVKMLYKNAKSKILINGHLTKSVDLSRGVRQGDPLSGLLYVLVIEILAIQLRENSNIIGFIVKKEKLVSFHYADDTTIAITQNRCWKEVIKELEIYEKASGSKINPKKSYGLWTGSWKNRTDKPMNITWTNGNVKALGIYVGNDKPNETLLKEIMEKIDRSLKFWKSFYFSKFAKARILEIFICSKLWYAAKFISIPANYQTIIQKKFNDFIIFPQKSNLVEQKEMLKLREDGGLKLIHVQTKSLAMKIKWITELFTNDSLSINKAEIKSTN